MVSDPKQSGDREEVPYRKHSWAGGSFSFRRMSPWQIGTFIAVLLVLVIIAAAWVASGPHVPAPI